MMESTGKSNRRLLTFGLFTLLQAILFIPVVIYFSFCDNTNPSHPTEGTVVIYSGFNIAFLNSYYFAIPITLIILIWHFISTTKRSNLPSYVLSLSFALFPFLLAFVFELTVGIASWNSELFPHRWSRYPRTIFQYYSVPMFFLTVTVVSVFKLIRYIKQSKK